MVTLHLYPQQYLISREISLLDHYNHSFLIPDEPPLNVTIFKGLGVGTQHLVFNIALREEVLEGQAQGAFDSIECFNFFKPKPLNNV